MRFYTKLHDNFVLEGLTQYLVANGWSHKLLLFCNYKSLMIKNMRRTALRENMQMRKF